MVSIRLKLLLLVASLTLAPVSPADARTDLPVRVTTLTTSVVRSVVEPLPFAARNVAVYWRGHPDATVTIAFSKDGKTFGRAIDVGRDEMGEHRADGKTYGSLLTTLNATAVRVRSSEPIKRLFVLGIRDRIREIVAPLLPADPGQPVVDPKTPRPAIASRADWAANESLRFRADGTEKWTPTFAPVAKLVVHHTDTPNGDRNPAATVRAIYHYHAITQDWGDIGYNFLIDESGRIYKGRNSHGTNGQDTISGQDAQGRGVTGAHALHHNRGSVGVALLGNLTNRDATPAAREALERLLAWEADAHGIDPFGASPYTSANGSQSSFPNISGHRDTGRATQCPGNTFHSTLPQLRNGVAARMT